jgi:DNA-binding NarL/FixJ family response regulator
VRESATPDIDSGKEPTVLVVDDDADWRALLALNLSSADGINLIGVVNDATAAVGVLEQLSTFAGDSPAVTVVVADVRMPGMSGLDLAAFLQKNRPDVRVVLFSSHMDDNAMIEARAVEVDAIVSKIDLRDLPTVIRSVSRPRVEAIDLRIA